ncbi:MAG: hypothetical protein IJ125_09890 [Atopobiaceae bacterium]|nr:hypothetical protein [Atopobiaceae bacterium]
MYHEKTKRDQELARRKLLSRVVAVFLVVALAVLAFFTVREYSRQQGAASMRDAILNSAKRCCAVEGSYPSSLDYLEENYGLSVNHNDYVITYEAYAGNVMPSVVVVPR